MRYLVDSNWIIDNLLNVQEAVDLLDKLSADGIAVSIITYMKVYEGTLRAQATQELSDAFTRFFYQCECPCLHSRRGETMCSPSSRTQATREAGKLPRLGFVHRGNGS